MAGGSPESLPPGKRHRMDSAGRWDPAQVAGRQPEPDELRRQAAESRDALREVQNLATLMEKVVKLTTDSLELDRQNIAARKEAEAYLVQAAGQ